MKVPPEELDESYWRGANHDSVHEAGYSHYDENSGDFDKYAEEVAELGEEPILVVGTALGYTQQILREEYGLEVYGVDVSRWAVGKAVAEFVYHGDILYLQDINHMTVGLGVKTFNTVYGERILSYMEDEEAVRAVQNMEQISEGRVIHRLYDFQVENEYYNVKPREEWMELCDPEENHIWL